MIQHADGAVGGQMKMAAAAGVLRDDQGRWISGFARSLGICLALSAELWAIHDSLSLAWNLGFRRIEMETDCAMAVKILKNNSRLERNGAITLLIYKLLKRDWEVKSSPNFKARFQASSVAMNIIAGNNLSACAPMAAKRTNKTTKKDEERGVDELLTSAKKGTAEGGWENML
ncbi:hypothetical protein F3Y22_tig00111877pilonHSYRG00338 [Hibiscus syriacus]|uniref:RNase H type-1 domain-containing protein n=1 Tax=Hibiscus syriacus TaxID=106335 RepID=A0A6A2X9P5_HIBSY|nr:hypothetical protein F3Y22_tig00111877pilonHSYRG00338 [Hibiscus syriacus]